MKAQILADFVAEITTHDQPTEVDGASNIAGSEVGMVLKEPHSIKMQHSINLNFPATNNSVEYEALIAGLRMTTVVKAECLKVQSDSQLVVNQVLDLFEVKDLDMRKYVGRVKKLLANITKDTERWELEQIPRKENKEADILAKAGASNETIPRITFIGSKLQ
ncbi:uncharacterized protein LOC126661896 [Mercurialis annua]|uniref:uncharacterized protein LOC126661896 n=1 Tax=Mercurialis annua TaxID=3986 RepID=UPI00215F105E|nr:uncharacterized protein LOC126661896 [Mercurialis annua]